MKLMSRNLRFMLLVLAMGGSAGVQAAAGLIGDPVAGEAKAGLCGGCHGADGNSEDATYPRLAGQYAGYILKQVKDFQKGHRTNNETMAGMAAMAGTTEDIKDIGSYFSQKKMKGKLTKTSSKLAAAGEKLFKQGNPKNGLYGCINCHGERGKGKAENISTFPRIGGQHRDYIKKQLKNFRAGERANDPAGMMAAIAKKLSDEEIDQVAEYLSSQL